MSKKKRSNKKIDLMPPVRIDYETGMKILLEELQAGQPAPEVDPTELDLNDISLARSVMQPRDLDWNMVESIDHVKTLVSAIVNKPDHKLDPIMVWWSGTCWRIIDGHHRYAAYRAAEREHDIRVKIPVTVFPGGPLEAVLEARAQNSKDKLVMKPQEKSNAAWHIVITKRFNPEMPDSEKLTDAVIALKCGVSPKLINLMNKALKKIIATAPEVNVHKLSWKDARELVGKGKKEDGDYDEQLVKLATEFSQIMKKHLHTRAYKNPQAFALALYMLSPKLANMLPGELMDVISDKKQINEDEMDLLVEMGDAQ